MVVVQGTTPGGVVATLSFDKETGLLVRLTRYNASPIGRIVTRTDYADYRDVNGVKLPFTWTLSWLDGRSVYTVTDVGSGSTNWVYNGANWFQASFIGFHFSGIVFDIIY